CERAPSVPLLPRSGTDGARHDQGGTFPSPLVEHSSTSLPPPRVTRASRSDGPCAVLAPSPHRPLGRRPSARRRDKSSPASEKRRGAASGPGVGCGRKRRRYASSATLSPTRPSDQCSTLADGGPSVASGAPSQTTHNSAGGAAAYRRTTP